MVWHQTRLKHCSISANLTADSFGSPNSEHEPTALIGCPHIVLSFLPCLAENMGSSDSSHTFTRLPTLEEDNVALLQPEDGSHDGSESSCHDEILDGLLSKVGYGTFQKRLLVSCSAHIICILFMLLNLLRFLP